MTRAATLRLSILVSLGIVPAACGGTTTGHPDSGTGDTGGGGATSVAGSRAHGGSKPQGGGGTIATGGSGVVTGGTSSGGSANINPTCTSPKLDPVTGLVSCSEGYSHRPQAKACGATQDETATAGAGGGGPDPGHDPVAKPRTNGSVSCDSATQAICNQFEYGFCDMRPGGGPALFACNSGCVTDADCGADRICLCDRPDSPTGGVCRAARCHTDKDCGGSLCTDYQEICGYGGFSCATAQDECLSSADCGLGGVCGPDPFGENSNDYHRVCTEGAVCGRPFLVHDRARVAPLASTGDWCSQTQRSPQTQHLTREERASLAAHWARLGQMEHASIAAFARFQLQLLALGAPPELIEGCTAALADETAHTKLCFELASAYAGRGLGPGPLDIDGSLTPTDLADVVDLVIAEGCYGETGAALEALEAADTASDPVIVAAYTQIARDEQRHAELAFRFVRWAIEQDARIADHVRSALVIERSVAPGVQDVVESCLFAVLTRRLAA